MKKQLAETQRQAVKILGVASYNTFDAYHLAGPANRQLRKQVYGLLIGRKATISESGVNNIRDTLWSLFEVTGDCIAARNDDLQAKCLLEVAESQVAA